MQTILGASGQIGRELAKELHRSHASSLRLVSRAPQSVNDSDELVSADLLDAEQTRAAAVGSEVVYFTAGLPADTARWESEFPRMLRNALDASRAAGARFAYFDNTYMYPQDDRIQLEDTPFAPVGRKGRVRARMAQMVLDEMSDGEIPVLIARAPEFYGPGRTQGFTNALIIDSWRAGRSPRVPVRDDRVRSLIWTPDASRALALLGNTTPAYGQTWHLPVDEDRLTFRELVEIGAALFRRDPSYRVVPEWVLRVAGIASKPAREMGELLPRYRHDNFFDSGRFRAAFPSFRVTPYREGLAQISREATSSGPQRLQADHRRPEG